MELRGGAVRAGVREGAVRRPEHAGAAREDQAGACGVSGVAECRYVVCEGGSVIG